jgi:IG-like fold at C-terminal of FixG, putative oxidoreductase
LPGLSVSSDEDVVTIESTQARWVAVRVQLPYEAAKPGSHAIHFEIAAVDSADKVSEKSVFIVPR